MPSKKAKKAIESVKSKIRQWTFETTGTRADFVGKIKDEKGKVILQIVENEDFNQLSRLLNTSKYMQNEHDMRGLAKYIWDRCLVPMEPEERDEWKKKRVCPVDIREVHIV
jgi:hypothetical protein